LLLHLDFQDADSKGEVSRTLPLSAVSVPDGARRFVISSLAPYRVGGSLVIDSDGEIVAEGEAESVRKNVVVVARPIRPLPGELRLRRPGGAAVRRTAVESIPQGGFADFRIAVFRIRAP